MNNLQKSCWRQIGVYAGDHSCTRLSEVSHCRNCPVYQDAARLVYQRENTLAEDVIDLWQAEKIDMHTALILRFGEQYYGIDSKILAEVVDDRCVRRVAHRDSRVLLGLIAVRGELRLLVNMPVLLGLSDQVASHVVPERLGKAEARMVILRDDAERYIAIRADGVLGMHQFDLSRATEPPSILPGELKSYVSAVVELAPLAASHTDKSPTGVKRVLLLKGAELIRLLETAWYQ